VAAALIGAAATIIVALIQLLPALLPEDPPPPTMTPAAAPTPAAIDSTVTEVSAGPPTTGDRPGPLPVCPSKVALGETIRCSIDQGSQVRRVSFAGARGDRIWLNVVATSGALDRIVEVARWDGNRLDCGGAIMPSTCTLDGAGIHTILVRSQLGTKTGDYQLHLQRLNRPEGCQALRLDAAPVNGSIATAASAGCYTFTAASNSQVQLNVVRTSGELDRIVEVAQADGDKLVCGG
jgi:hypothetical protein